jgi:nitroreductase
VTPSEDAYLLVRGLRAVRRFRPDPLPDRVLEEILEAGRWTGSAKNSQPWALVVVSEAEQRERLAGCGTFSDPLRAAPLVVALVRRPRGYEFDIGRLAQNLMLGAAALGVASCPVTLHDDDCARRVLGVPPDHGCRFAIAFGYPEEDRGRPGTRVPGGRRALGEVVHQERWQA